MTGYTVHTGTSKKFASGWDRVFTTGAKAKAAAKSGSRRTRSKSKSRKKS